MCIYSYIKKIYFEIASSSNAKWRSNNSTCINGDNTMILHVYKCTLVHTFLEIIK